jgi:restriction endonuclease S subunit
MKIPLPSLEEQQHIVALATRIEDAIGLQQQAVTRFDVLLSSILDKAFKGEL